MPTRKPPPEQISLVPAKEDEPTELALKPTRVVGKPRSETELELLEKAREAGIQANYSKQKTNISPHRRRVQDAFFKALAENDPDIKYEFTTLKLRGKTNRLLKAFIAGLNATQQIYAEMPTIDGLFKAITRYEPIYMTTFVEAFVEAAISLNGPAMQGDDLEGDPELRQWMGHHVFRLLEGVTGLDEMKTRLTQALRIGVEIRKLMLENDLREEYILNAAPLFTSRDILESMIGATNIKEAADRLRAAMAIGAVILPMAMGLTAKNRDERAMIVEIWEAGLEAIRRRQAGEEGDADEPVKRGPGRPPKSRFK